MTPQTHTGGDCGASGLSSNPDELSREMSAFVSAIPASLGIDWAKELEFLRYFEAPRLILIEKLLSASGWTAEKLSSVLDFGYLHGLISEFLHRAYPKAEFTVCDLPSSPVFQNAEYQRLIAERSYAQLRPLNIDDVREIDGQFDAIILGEIIEHLDPTRVARALENLLHLSRPETTLVITTPNAISLKNVVFALDGRDAEHPPIPDPIMGHGHIHLWSYALLKKTMEAIGWDPVDVVYFHGFEELERERARQGLGSLKWRMVLRVLFAIAERVPRWRGFFVSTWRPRPLQASH